MTTLALPTETAVWLRLLEPRKGNLPIAAARAFLKLEFAAADRERMHALTLKHQDESLSDQELAELDAYRRAGRVLDLMHSKSRLSLNRRDPTLISTVL